MKLWEKRGAAWHLHPVLFVYGLIALLAGQGDLLSLSFLALALHEMGHLRAAQRRNVAVLRMDLSPIGALAQLDPAFETAPADEAAIALAGPAASAFWGLMGLAAQQVCVRFALPAQEMLAQRWVQIHFTLLALNLLPALPLDGGRVLRALLAGPLGLRRATILSACLGLLLALLFFAVGLCATAALHRVALTYLTLGTSLLLGALSCLRQSAALTVRAHALRPAVGRDRPLPVRRLAVDASAGAVQTLAQLWQPGYYEILVCEKGLAQATLTREDLLRAVQAGARTMRQAVSQPRTKTIPVH